MRDDRILIIIFYNILNNTIYSIIKHRKKGLNTKKGLLDKNPNKKPKYKRELKYNEKEKLTQS
jgi:hypothetical protein